MSDAIEKFRINISEADICLSNYDKTNDEFTLRHIWITSVSSFDLYMTELISEAALRLIDRTPRRLTQNLQQIGIPLSLFVDFDKNTPAERLVLLKRNIFSHIQYRSFYRPDKISEALSFIWTCPAKEKWARILSKLKLKEGYEAHAEDTIRDELTLIADRRDLIAHSVDTSPGGPGRNPVTREDAAHVLGFIRDIAEAIDTETERQLAE